MLSVGLTTQRRKPLQARTNGASVIAALPFALYRYDAHVSGENAGRRKGAEKLSRNTLTSS
jgi:hypothetical protein